MKLLAQFLRSQLIIAAAVLIFLPASAISQSAVPRQTAAPAGFTGDPDEIWTIPDRNRINAGTVTVITAPAGGATSIFGSDMARVLDDDQNALRVLPVLGKGPVRNVVDVLYLKSIDMGAVACDVPEFYKLQYGIPDITSKLRYIAKLYNNEVHVVAPTSIRSIFDLQGKRIVASTDVGYYSARVILNRLGIDATFDYRTDDARAIQKITEGKADAYIGSTGKVFTLLRNIDNRNRNLHLVAIPYDRRLQDLYLPTTFSSDEYPNLVPPGQAVDTVATGVLLVTYNWPPNTEQYARVAKFVDAFFSHIEDFYKPPRHPKWKESSIVINVAGWQRFKAAQDWLDRNGVGSAPADGPPVASARSRTYSAVPAEPRNGTSEANGRLFREFLEQRNGASR